MRRRDGRSSGRGRTRHDGDGSWAEGRGTRGGGAARKRARGGSSGKINRRAGRKPPLGHERRACRKKCNVLFRTRDTSRGVARELRENGGNLDGIPLERYLPPDAARAERERERKQRERKRRKGASEIENFVAHTRWNVEILQRKIEKIYAGAECDEKKAKRSLINSVRAPRARNFSSEREREKVERGEKSKRGWEKGRAKLGVFFAVARLRRKHVDRGGV